MASDAGNHISTVIRQILSRTLSETIVSYAGTSQYSVGGAGTAACGLAALNFARVVFEHDQHRTSLGDPLVFVCKVLSRETIQNAISICSAWSSDLHMEVEEIFNVPLFNTCMKLCSTKYGTPGLSQFRGLLSDLTRLDSSAAAIITRPPEILACVTLKLSRAAHVFLVFDSHPREKYPDGSGITITCSVEIAARCLSQLFPVISLPDSGLDWQAQLLSNYSGHIFTPRAVDDRSAYLTQVAIESSIRLLSLRATVASLTSRNAMLERENESLESQVQGLEGELRDRKSKIKTQRPRSHNPSSKSSINQQSRPGPSSTSPRSSPSSSSSHRGSTSPEPHTPSSDSDTDMSGYSAAIRQQRFYDAEHEVLREEQRQLVRTSQKTFDCGICFDSYPEDVVLRVDACGHGYCRDCMKGVITSKIDEHRYPIFCPTCSVARTPQSAEPAEITEDLIVCVDLEERQFAVWNEMQMAKFSILLHCRKCSQSFFADKMDHDEINIIACPVRACRHVWCKDCQQTIEMGSGPRHSCDGSSELDHLVRTQGWKYCPTCRTPVQKIVGCNHMTCITPGCNTHFCYLCGGLIVQSALQAEIRSATSAHYRRCQLFEIPR